MTTQMARCHRCGDPCLPILLGSAAEVEANPMITVWCRSCAITAEAEAITKEAVDGTA